jgi:hypothetical protein
MYISYPHWVCFSHSKKLMSESGWRASSDRVEKLSSRSLANQAINPRQKQLHRRTADRTARGSGKLLRNKDACSGISKKAIA